MVTMDMKTRVLNTAFDNFQLVKVVFQLNARDEEIACFALALIPLITAILPISICLDADNRFNQETKDIFRDTLPRLRKRKFREAASQTRITGKIAHFLGSETDKIPNNTNPDKSFGPQSEPKWGSVTLNKVRNEAEEDKFILEKLKLHQNEVIIITE